MILPHVFFTCFYSSSNTSALLSSWIAAASPHTNICCHWNQLMLGQQTQDLMTICITCKQKCSSNKTHPGSHTSMTAHTFDTIYQMSLSQAPMWVTLKHHFDKNKQFSFSNQWSILADLQPGKNILRRTYISALLFWGTGKKVPYYMQASSPYI